MTSPADMHRGLALRSYLAATHLIPLVAKPMLRRRLKRGKEDPGRWQEKLGHGLASRPDGPLIWLHAVGLGEVLSLRGLIDRLAKARPDLSFLVTSNTAASAKVFAENAPARTIHQFLPLDAPPYRKRFLDHFAPDLCIWVEQDIWPGMVNDLSARGIPQCMIAARMNARSFKSHYRAASLFRDIYGAMALVMAQDAATADHLRALGAAAKVGGSLKPAAPALRNDPDEVARLRKHLTGRRIWAVAPAHAEDIAIACAAHTQLCKVDTSALLIIAPRFPDRPLDLQSPRRSLGEMPDQDNPIWLFDTFGELGLVYRLADAALIGGTFGDIEGHNPWEAAALGCAILHGPHTANFSVDFAHLADLSGAIPVETADDLVAALTSPELDTTINNASDAIAAASAQVDDLAQRLLQVLEASNAA
ncbi:3-deoxy-D-manno-octulosonic acid transferase [Roseobacter sp. CCS2]|uniref:3-deoxy-D-manno-octulosonic acid transferase n=1 Tax=Roseobacter sp. CCS2 TaxID=391593 RepID=UPI0000F400BE|nr:glycosyltransferase N-terminal domain-containing protein [Roseobacter sp. CCS2]EBA13251.1 Three-deoxy-D-manno-octulosonic-acid transferase-like protein [Roseobacter sp. CCS2]